MVTAHPSVTLPTAADVDAAYDVLRDVVVRTPLQPSARLSDAVGARVHLKREDLQAVRSYKLRGAYTMLVDLYDAARDRGVVCASAGNHAQGVAYACARLGLAARIYVPGTTPRQKRRRIAALGGDRVEIRVVGDTYDASSALAREDAARTGAVLVPAFDDPRVVAGQGTVIREIVEDLGHAPDVLVVPVGGGGLMAGSLTWLAENAPATKVFGVEPRGAASMAAALGAGGPVTLETLDRFVDGAAVRRVGDVTAAVAAAHRPGLVEVDPGLLCEEMIDLFEVEGIIAEPAGALATAALRRPLRSIAAPLTGDVVAVVSGGNHDVSRYAEVIERALVSQGLKHYWLVEFPQEPGALRTFLDVVLGPDDDVTLFEYVKRNSRETGPALVGIELGSADELPALEQRLADSPITGTKLDPDDPIFQYLL